MKATLAQAFKTFTAFLEKKRVPYMVIGGIANLVWGRPRLTLDIDVGVWAPGDAEEALARALIKKFEARPPDPLAFVEEMHVLPLKIGGVCVDVVFGHLPYDRAAIARAQPVDFLGTKARICGPEDLILQKLASPKAKDRDDVEGIIKAQGRKLKRESLDLQVKTLSENASRPEIWTYYLSCFEGL